MDFKDSTKQKRIILHLRWVTIIVTSYLILFNRGISSPESALLLLILGYLSSNLIAYFIPTSYFSKLSFFYIVLLFDTLMISLGIYLTGKFESDFYLAYFLVILFASIARNFKLLLVNSIVICAIYGWTLWMRGLEPKDLEEGILLRIPFIFVVTLFYGFLTQSFEKRTQEIKRELKELEESEKRYRQIVESSHDSVAILDEKNRIKFFNRRLAQLTQYSPEEVSGMALERILREPELETFLQGLVSNSDGNESVIRETDILRKDGESRKVEASASRFSMPSGQSHTILYLKDVTERRQMEERMVQSEKLRALGELAAGVAHDLNNVLGAILGRARLIRLSLGEKGQGAQGMPKDAIQRELGIIERAALDGSQTIKKIQEFSRPKSEDFYFLPLNINEIVEETIDLMKPKIKDESEEKGISIQIQKVVGEVVPVMGNPTELREVLVNLFINAMDALPEGGTITFRTGMEGGYVFIEVGDNGIGMPKSIQQRIFDPFFTTKGLHRSGLGLSISYGIIQRHRGEIYAESEEGLGTTFMVRLPIAEEKREV